MSKNLRASAQIPRIKSLIKPPPPRTSWELLLDDYLKDPHLLANLIPKSSQNPSQPYLQTTSPIYQSTFANSGQTTIYPSQQLNYTSCPTCHQKSSLRPRRYEINLDEIVYLISQIGRADFYREMVQYVQTQQLPMSSNHPASNTNAYTTETSNESFFLNNLK